MSVEFDGREPVDPTLSSLGAVGRDEAPPVRWTPTLWTVAVGSAGLAAIGAVLQAAGSFQLDINVYLMGARHLVDGRLYLASLPQRPHLPFTYPPFAALAFGPLAILPSLPAQVVWSLVNVVALFALVWLSVRAARPGLDRSTLLLWSMILMTPAYWIEPVHLTFGYGQVNIVLAAMALYDLTGQARFGRRTLPRGVLVGVAAAVKLTPLVFVPFLFVTRQVRAGCTALAVFVACSGVSALIDPRSSWSYWTEYVSDASRIGAVAFISNQSLRAVIDRTDHRLVSSGPVTLAAALILVLGLALAGWAARHSSNLLGVLVCATTGLLVSPITWAHHMVWVVPVLAWLIWAPDRPAGGRVWAALGAALFWWAPIWSVPSGGNVELSEHGWQLLRGNSFFLAMVIFMVGVAVMLAVRRHDRRGTEQARTDQRGSDQARTGQRRRVRRRPAGGEEHVAA
jgi:alpha-1,2-mannosyltransferase